MDDQIFTSPVPYGIDVSGEELDERDIRRLKEGLKGLLARNRFYATGNIADLSPLPADTENILAYQESVGLYEPNHDTDIETEYRTGHSRMPYVQYSLTHHLLTKLLDRLEDVDSLTFAEFSGMTRDCQIATLPSIPEMTKPGQAGYRMDLFSGVSAGCEMNAVASALSVFSELALNIKDKKIQEQCRQELELTSHFYCEDPKQHMELAARQYIMERHAQRAEKREVRPFFDQEKERALYNEVRLSTAVVLGMLDKKHMHDYSADSFETYLKQTYLPPLLRQLDLAVKETLQDAAKKLGLRNFKRDNIAR